MEYSILYNITLNFIIYLIFTGLDLRSTRYNLWFYGSIRIQFTILNYNLTYIFTTFFIFT